ncbi:MAG: hypothetical protein H6738_16975 [Alphaproteobacteria bacterium]|nr:hypothetical protein [Alphaproteobacteria bacterium]MCB9698477.1 hypothetical protein [Alphaproteobacteria bacterium]
MILSLGLLACNRYDLFLMAGGNDRESNDADVLFVIDNSDSMFEESVALAENFGGFVERLAGREVDYGTDGLPDAVDRYVDYVQNPGYFVDFQLAITTTDVQTDRGALVGDPPILRKGDPDLEEKFIRNLMCEATCFADRRQVDSDPGVTCEQDWNGKVTQEFLDCLCGRSAWVGHCGLGAEEGLEAVLDAMCRADDTPEACHDDRSPLQNSDFGTNEGLLRDGATFIPVVMTDEGDGSRRTANLDALPTAYFEAFAEFDRFMSWAVVAPGLDSDYEVRCPGLAQSWGVLRYIYLVQESGGLYQDVNDENCDLRDWGAALDQIGDLVGGGAAAFPLSSTPKPGSIAVQVGHREIKPSEALGADLFGQPLFGDGWTFRAEDDTVLLHGAALPTQGEVVTIWFLPQ